jgi:hypothetical protein
MSNIINFPGETSLDIDANEMLKNACEEFDFESVVLVGFTGEEEFTLCSSVGKSSDMVFMLEMGKHAVIQTSQG